MQRIFLKNKMAYYILNSDITIGTFRFSGVKEVRIKRSLRDYTDTATITIPAIGRVQQGTLQADGTVKICPGTAVVKNVRSLFNNNDPVTIRLGYNGDLQTEFKGFVKNRGTGLHCVINCEGYVRQMRLGMDITHYYPKTTVSELLGLISTSCPAINVVIGAGADLPLLKMRLTHATGVDICNEIRKVSEGALTIFFLDPTTLWCGLRYTPYAKNIDPFDTGNVNYRRGYNCIKDESLKEVEPTEPVQVILNGVTVSAQRVQTQSEASYSVRKEKTLVNNVGDINALRTMANEVQYQRNYTGFEGHIPAFLQPFAQPGYTMYIKDTDNPDLNGTYMCEGIDVSFGTGGARRNIEVGPKVGFNPNPPKMS